MKLTLFLLLFSFAMNALGQNVSLSGKITDERNNPLPGVTVRLSPSMLATQSDASGYFTFPHVPAGHYSLTFSYTGYRQQVVPVHLVGGGTEVNINLYPAPQELGEVVVAGDRTEFRKREESMNVEVVNEVYIRRNLGGSLMKSLERQPGIKTIGIGSGQSKPLIRGLGFNRVVVVENGVKHEGQQWGVDHGLEIDQFAASQVELIKGAASFVYGSDAIAGAIDIKPHPVPPKHTLGGAVDIIGKTNNNLYGTSLNLYGRKERWFFDSRVTRLDYADYRVPTSRVYVYDYAVDLKDNRLRNTAGHETNLHLSTGVVEEKYRSVFYLSNTYSKSGFFANAHGLEPRRVNTEEQDASHRDILMPYQKVNHFKLINRSSFSLPGHEVEAELGYQKNFRQEFSPYVNHGYMPPLYPTRMRTPQTLEREFEKQVYSLNIKDNMAWGRHTLAAGVNTEYQDNSIGGWSFLVPAFRQFSAGAFLYDKFTLNEHWLLHGALRYDYGKIKITKYTDWFNSDVQTQEGTVSQALVRADSLQRQFQSFIWSAGFNYNREKLQLKANLGKSFRMPIAKELAANGVNYHYFSYEKGDPGLSPEQSYQLDVSVTWTQPKWSVQLSSFYNYFPNYIYLNPTSRHDYYYGAGNQVFQYAQSSVMRYGAEFEAKYRFLKHWSTEFLAEYLYSEQLSGEKKGYTLPFSPPPTAIINISYEPQFSRGPKNTYFSLDYRLTGSQYRIVPPEKKTPASQVLNFSAGTTLRVSRQELSISVQAQNLLNTRYLNHTSFYRLIELPEAGRNIILSLKVPFTLLRHD
ncbi:TonB-dependent receptor [Rufibacter immobilis]|uniref:TonB-dependent receptor n=1 Tax=Rufibacter immobilis TaxID=1348778 RepID=A0A3M9MTF3_9BACT|nr:TonB-dependent receptor [Rufibacter immobilis]RNI28477.1 TonB-dependent receptor [Rufibacter immobilis]